MSISWPSAKGFLIAYLLIFPLLVIANTDDLDFKHLHETALLAASAYLPEPEAHSRLKPLGWRIVKHNEIPVTAVQYFLAVKGREQLIVVRGTANAENVVVDLDLQLQPQADLNIDLHQGFASAATAILDDLKDKLNKTQPVQTAGHSLGGAVAQVLAMKLDTQGLDVTNVTTYGQPKVTNISGAKTFEHLPLIRVVTPLDLVPIVPALSPLDLERLDVYWHSGTELILLEEGQFAVTRGLSSMLRATQFLQKVPDQSNAQAHEIQTYIALLATLRANAVEVPYKSDLSLFGFRLD